MTLSHYGLTTFWGTTESARRFDDDMRAVNFPSFKLALSL